MVETTWTGSWEMSESLHSQLPLAQEGDGAHVAREVRDTRPAFILCPPRSGSTLLRHMLDAHDEIVCPAETNIALVFATMAETIRPVLESRQEASQDAFVAVCRGVADWTHGRLQRAKGASRWADKSLGSVLNADLLNEIYPDAQFICLFRGWRDTVASLLEASPYGFEFGLEGYVHSTPRNTLAACARLWADCTSAMLAFSSGHSDRCFHIRYEEMVSSPEATCEELFAFLGLGWSPSSWQQSRVFEGASETLGDFKLPYTRRFHTDSIGRGWNLPVSRIPSTLSKRLDELSAAAGYDPQSEQPRGHDEEEPVAPLELELNGTRVRLEFDPHVPIPLPRPKSEAARASALDDAGQGSNGVRGTRVDYASVEELLRERVIERLKTATASPELRAGKLKVDLQDRDLGWMIDLGSGAVQQSNAEAPISVFTDSETLLAIANGVCNFGLAKRRGTICVSCATIGDETTTFDQQDKIRFWELAFLDMVAADAMSQLSRRTSDTTSTASFT